MISGDRPWHGGQKLIASGVYSRSISASILGQSRGTATWNPKHIVLID